MPWVVGSSKVCLESEKSDHSESHIEFEMFDLLQSHFACIGRQSKPHMDEFSRKTSVCMYVCLYKICKFDTKCTNLYYNGFAGRVQKSSHAFLRQTWARFAHPQCCALF